MGADAGGDDGAPVAGCMRAQRRIELEQRVGEHGERQRAVVRAALEGRGWLSTAEVAARVPWSVRTVGDVLESLHARDEVLVIGGLHAATRAWCLRVTA